MSALEDVRTVEEIATDFFVSVRGVQKACEHATAKWEKSPPKRERWCRKAGGTWLIDVFYAIDRWPPRITDADLDQMAEDQMEADDNVDHSYMLDDDIPEEFIGKLRRDFPPKEY